MAYIIKGNGEQVPFKVEERYGEIAYKAYLSDSQLQQALEKKMILEEDHELICLPPREVGKKAFQSEAIIFVTLTSRKLEKDYAYYYHMKKKKWEKGEIIGKGALSICCYTEGDCILASDYLTMLDVIHQLGEALSRKVIWWGNIESKLPFYAQNSLIQQVERHYSQQYKSLFLLQNPPYHLRHWQQAEKRIYRFIGKEKMIIEQTKARELLKQLLAISDDNVTLTNESPFQGKGVYIGLVTACGEHGEAPTSNLAQDTSRLSCIWEQISGENGQYFAGEMLKAHMPKGPIWEQSLLPMIKRIGAVQGGVAQKAEILIAKLNPTCCRDSMMEPSEKEGFVPIEDFIIGAEKLSALAKANHKPLILLMNGMPYLGEQLAFSSWLMRFAREAGHLVIVPAGDGGIEGKYYKLQELIQGKGQLTLRIENQDNKGTIRLAVENGRFCEVHMISPEEEVVELSLCEDKKVGKGTIQSTGIYLNQHTGEEELIWKMENLSKGTWQIAVVMEEGTLGPIRFFMEEEGLNRFHFLETSSQRTLNCPDEVGLIVTGCFNEKEQVIYGFSGRGDIGCHPTLVISDQLLNGKWQSTLEAACLMAGLAACLYEKMLAWDEGSQCQSEVLKKKVIHSLIRFQEAQYPNQGEGYGLLNKAVVKRLLQEGEWDD